MKKALNLLQRDVFRLHRDNLLLFLIAYPIAIAILARLVAPMVPIEHFVIYIAPPMIMFAPLSFGMVFGFNLIEEKEEQTWLLIRVVPLRVAAYFVYLVAVTALPAFALSLVTALLYGQPVANPGQFILMVFATALTAPLWALMLGVIAHNKVEGLALTKTISFITLAPGLAFILSPTWQVTVGWNPWYWSYLGLIKAFTSEAVLGELAIIMPGYPSFIFWLAPVILSLAAVVGLSRAWRQRVE
ncbi:MAG: hypothetical protein IBX64_12075 [Actinobacteria bacterium]|nr:hypothetical protein [Actinomycetota bacterium]